MGICNMECYQYIENKEISNLSNQQLFSKNKNKNKLNQIIPTTHSEVLITHHENSLSDTNNKEKENQLKSNNCKNEDNNMFCTLKNKKPLNENFFDNYNQEEDIIIFDKNNIKNKTYNKYSWKKNSIKKLDIVQNDKQSVINLYSFPKKYNYHKDKYITYFTEGN